MKIICVVSARPNFMKIAPLMEAFKARTDVQPLLLHTGQHYDDNMSGVFFRELGLPEPDFFLGCSGTGATPIAEMIVKLEDVFLKERPNGIVVPGDVNGAFASAFVASRLGIKIAHVEAGLRSFDRSMPEEINRILVDHISDLLFCTEDDAVRNLRGEGIPEDRVILAGNVMIDSLVKNLPFAEESTILDDLNLTPKRYAVATLHRPALVDHPERLAEIFGALEEIAKEIPVLWPVHPRTKKNLDSFGLQERLRNASGLRAIEPLGYLELLKLNANAFCVLTDSGGIQEETTVLRTPCITIRENTERPCTCKIGSNQLAGLSAPGVLDAWKRVIKGNYARREVPTLWDGHAAERIAKTIIQRWKP